MTASEHERQSARNAAEIRSIRSAAEKHGERCREEKTHGRGWSVGRSGDRCPNILVTRLGRGHARPGGRDIVRTIRS